MATVRAARRSLLINTVMGVRGCDSAGRQKVTLRLCDFVPKSLNGCAVPESVNVSIRVVLSAVCTIFYCESNLKCVVSNEVSSVEYLVLY